VNHNSATTSLNEYCHIAGLLTTFLSDVCEIIRMSHLQKVFPLFTQTHNFFFPDCYHQITMIDVVNIKGASLMQI
jgi:hypothetical protein